MTKPTKYFAPGRINLIGEHIDYNGGFVLPAALTIGITATVTPNNSNKITLRSATHPFVKEVYLNDDIVYSDKNGWSNYPLGVIAHLIKEGNKPSGCDILFESNLPERSGLSSSAAVEVLTGFALLGQTQNNINLPWLANFCKQVENEFIGLQCGIMDQYAVALGKKDCAILLDCQNLKHDYIPIELGDYRLMVMNTMKQRSLVTSKYNERKSESDEALRIIKTTQTEVENLCGAKMHHLDLITDEAIKKRARHVITENLRVLESVKALRYNDLSTFGRLLNAGHASIKNDYEASGIELDTLAETAQQIKGCLGARMTGGGFSGCAIAIVHHNSIQELKEKAGSKYFEVTGLHCEIYESEIGDGVRRI